MCRRYARRILTLRACATGTSTVSEVLKNGSPLSGRRCGAIGRVNQLATRSVRSIVGETSVDRVCDRRCVGCIFTRLDETAKRNVLLVLLFGLRAHTAIQGSARESGGANRKASRRDFAKRFNSDGCLYATLLRAVTAPRRNIARAAITRGKDDFRAAFRG